MSSIAFIQNKFNSCSVTNINTCITYNSKYVKWKKKGKAIFVSVDCFAKKCRMSGKRCDEIIFHEEKSRNKGTTLDIYLIEAKSKAPNRKKAIAQLNASAKYMEKHIKQGEYKNHIPIIAYKSKYLHSKRRERIGITMHGRTQIIKITQVLC